MDNNICNYTSCFKSCVYCLTCATISGNMRIAVLAMNYMKHSLLQISSKERSVHRFYLVHVLQCLLGNICTIIVLTSLLFVRVIWTTFPLHYLMCSSLHPLIHRLNRGNMLMVFEYNVSMPSTFIMALFIWVNFYHFLFDSSTFLVYIAATFTSRHQNNKRLTKH